MSTLASATSEPSAAAPLIPPRYSRDRLRYYCLGVILLAAQLPLLLKLFNALWQRPQYQFYPVMLIGAAYLAWERWRDLPRRETLQRGSSTITLVLVAMSLAALLLGGLFWLRSLALISTMLTIAAIAWHAGGMRLLRTMLPSLILLAVIVPPPGHLDDTLTIRLQHLAVRGSSQFLDLLRIPHVESGNVLEIPGRRLLVEQACAGINSLMSILGFALLLGFYRRRPAAHILALLPGAFFFVVMANLVRITGEAWLKVRWNIDVLEGSRHELLGMLLFFVCAALVVSLDALIQILFPRSREQAPRAEATPLVQSAAPPRRLAMMEFTIAIAFAVTGLFVQLRTASAWPAPAIRDDAVFHLPHEIAGWHQVDDKDGARIERPQILAAKSSIWRFRQGNMIASVAIDYPFVGFHDLTTCYAQAGWSIDNRTDPAATGQPTFTRVGMNKSSVLQSDLLFGELDESGKWIGPDIPVSLAELGALRTWLLFSRHDATSGPTYQVQTFVQSYVPLSTEQHKEIEQLFHETSESLAKQTAAQLRSHR